MGKLKAVDLRRTEPGLYGDGDGLYLQVRSGKNGPVRSWILRYVENGRQHDMGLGPVRFIGLAEARKATLDAQRLRLQGIDPLQHRKAQAAATAKVVITFGKCAEDYFEANAAAWRNTKHRRMWEASLAKLPLKDMAVSGIDVDTVISIIKPLWHKTPVTASRLRTRIEQVLAYAIALGYRAGPNPASWELLQHVLPAARTLRPVVHFKALPWQDVPGFMGELRSRESTSARALEFLVLTASRSAEVIGATWGEIDVANATWTVPMGRMKGGAEHRVPLSARCVEIIKGQRSIRRGDYVFGGVTAGRPLGINALSQSLNGLCTVHGFRSAFRDWAGDNTNYSREVAEAALAHRVGNQVEQAYRRGSALEKRRQLMSAWASFCERPAAEGGSVVPMAPRRR